MRYAEQLMHSLEVLVDPSDRRGSRLAGDFTAEYARRYGAAAASAFQAAEVFALRVLARAPTAIGAVTGAATGPALGTSEALLRPAAPVYWPDAGQRLDTDVYDGDWIPDGEAISGPALVELSHTTIAVPRGATLAASRGHFRLKLPSAPTAVKGAES
jgi:N-methylhydantoinase A